MLDSTGLLMTQAWNEGLMLHPQASPVFKRNWNKAQKTCDTYI